MATEKSSVRPWVESVLIALGYAGISLLVRRLTAGGQDAAHLGQAQLAALSAVDLVLTAVAVAILFRPPRRFPVGRMLFTPETGLAFSGFVAAICYAAALALLALDFPIGDVGVTAFSGLLVISEEGWRMLLFVFRYLLEPAAQVLLFNGLIQRRLRTVTDPWAALAASAGLFALAHLLLGGPAQGLYALGVGLIAALAYEKTAALLAPWLCQAGARLGHILLAFASIENERTTVLIIYIFLLVYGITALVRHHADDAWGDAGDAD
jgi:membrane protease YdiL (CAAX protease family)